MFSKSKRKVKDATWRDYRSLIGLLVLWFGIIQLSLSFDPFMLKIIPIEKTLRYEIQIEYAINVALVSLWMLGMYGFGRKRGFSRKWTMICVSATLIAMLMLTIENHYGNYPPNCVYEQVGNSVVWIRTRFTCFDGIYQLF